PVVNYLPVDVFGPTKLCVIEVIVLLGTLMVPRRQVNRPRWSWWDLPMAAWVVMPGISEAANGLGAGRVVAALGIVTAMCNVYGAVIVMVLAMIGWVVSALLKTRVPLVVLLALPLIYMVARASGAVQMGEGGYIQIPFRPHIETQDKYLG